ncbi:MAG: tRNA uridine-5-carboxymethylaminomethyl(34) synthesis GTPase MnmE [Vampirovibrionales bacterium]|nr:tRNA uridine-5-carboxymethylaminomethyl(34) synthesis GTPase MnmE [Vampirovibrionales bacterium]
MSPAFSHLKENTTIAAIATARGQGGVSIIRISGPEAFDIAGKVFVSAKSLQAPKFRPGRIYHGWINSHVEEIDKSPTAACNNQETFLDEVLLLCFKAPNSFTGEDVIEIQGHGGDYLSHLLLERCLFEGAVLAQPGEFTKRAFLNGKLDLTQAESVMDLVSAQNERLLHLASANLKNRSLGSALDEMKRQLIALQTHLVAHTDFPDEVEAPDRSDTFSALTPLIHDVSHLAQAAERNRLLREGFKVAILGLPNSGKSSLFNALLASERAIVTEIAGTTRDVITETLVLEGVNITLLDTAGIRETGNTVEKIGIERSWHAAEEAQVVLYMIDSGVGLTNTDTDNLAQIQKIPTLLLANKMDLFPKISPKISIENALPVSAKTGDGLDKVLAWLSGHILKHFSQDETASGISLNQRQRQCVANILIHLKMVSETLQNPHLPLDLATVPLSDALYEFDKLSGQDTTEAVLDEVFSQFCVGK